jgi:OPT oligopeptide transporter protein
MTFWSIKSLAHTQVSHHANAAHVGLDVLPITFDWAQITGFLLSPLMTPFWAIGNIVFGFAFWIWFITPILHFTNVWYGKYLPISTPGSYDNTGANYNVSRILNPAFEFDLAKYKAYSPLFLGTTFALAYGQSFASITSVLVHVYLFHGSEIWAQFKQSLDQDEDIHMKLNRVYRQAPDWWYLALGVVTFAMSVVACEAWETRLVSDSLDVADSALVGGCPRNRFGASLFRSHRCHPGHLQLSARIECSNRVYCRIHFCRETDSQHDFQGLWIHGTVRSHSPVLSRRQCRRDCLLPTT